MLGGLTVNVKVCSVFFFCFFLTQDEFLDIL
jgi:hypothetical protein